MISRTVTVNITIGSCDAKDIINALEKGTNALDRTSVDVGAHKLKELLKANFDSVKVGVNVPEE
tara:strand:- start:422 stop:613 length:192 start_codon:yes stop_codon:yes gene_type:complete